jgi:choline dehydrogenase
MVYIRGQKQDYDAWAALGNSGWSYDDVLPYFKKQENRESGANEYHGTGGELNVARLRHLNPLTEAFTEAAVETQYPRNDDFNGAQQDGAGLYQLTQRGGMRCSAAVAYLHPALERPNLRVEPFLHAHRVVFEGTRAVGVEASRLGQVETYRAAREVSRCGGAYNSPQLLQLSGIGPAEHLALREVPVLVDQPEVGENLSDHPAVTHVWTTPEPVSLLVALEPAALEEFVTEHTGPLTSNVAVAGAFARVEPGAPAPDVQFHAVPVQIVDEGLSDPTGHGIWIAPCLLTPHSRGSVRLASADPSAKPVIRHNYHAAEADMERMLAAVRLTLEIAGQEALRRYCSEPFTVPAGDDDAALRAHVARHTTTLYHPAGTCAIGRVVDPELRVSGVEALRVVDASVMPVVPRGNTNAPTIAIAERAADLLRGIGAAEAEAEAAVAHVD